MGHIVRDGWRAPTGTKVYAPTGKEPEPWAKGDTAYWTLADKIEGVLGSVGGTLGDIYYRVTRPLGLSLDDTRELVLTAKRYGYLR